jgi:hypothetical protein
VLWWVVIFSAKGICLAHKGVEIHDSRPDLRLYLPISAQGLSAMSLAGLPASGKLARRYSGGLFWVKVAAGRVMQTNHFL